jgi:uncharacterized membrane protein
MKTVFNRNTLFILFIVIGVAFLHKPLIQLARLSLNNQLYSYFLGIPVVSLYFFVVNRKTILKEQSYSKHNGLALLAAGIAVVIRGVYGLLRYPGISQGHISVAFFDVYDSDSHIYS